MATCMWATGRKTAATVMASILMSMELFTRAFGSMTNIMGMGKKSGQMVLSLKATTDKVRNMGKVTFSGPMEASSEASSSITKWKAMGYTSGSTDANTMVSGRKICSMARGTSLGKMAASMLASMLMTSVKATEFSHGKYKLLFVEHSSNFYSSLTQAKL